MRLTKEERIQVGPEPSQMEIKMTIDEEYIKTLTTRSELYAYARRNKWTLFGGAFNSFKQRLANWGIDYNCLPLNRDEKIESLLNEMSIPQL